MAVRSGYLHIRHHSKWKWWNDGRRNGIIVSLLIMCYWRDDDNQGAVPNSKHSITMLSIVFYIFFWSCGGIGAACADTHTHNRTLYSSEIKIEETMSSGQITFQHFYRCPSSARWRALIFLSPTKTSCLRIYFHKLFSLSLCRKIGKFDYFHGATLYDKRWWIWLASTWSTSLSSGRPAFDVFS